MSSMMGGSSTGQTGQPQQTGQASLADSQAVRSGATGASGIQGGGSTPAYSWMQPQVSGGLAKAGAMSFDDWLKTLGNTALNVGKQRLQQRVGDASAGLSSFQQPNQAQGSHSVSIASLYGGSGGGS